MAPEDNWKRIRDRREREDRDADPVLDLPKPKGQKEEDGKNLKLIPLIERAEPMIDQVNSLYHQYFVGVEKRPPIEIRHTLENLVVQIKAAPKVFPMDRFRYRAFMEHYQTFVEKWERAIKIHDNRPRKKMGK